ncbi:hypothetical protein D3C72_1468160 [compost metagenome]
MSFFQPAQDRLGRHVNQPDFICQFKCIRWDAVTQFNARQLMGKLHRLFQLIDIYGRNHTDIMREQIFNIIQPGREPCIRTVEVGQPIYQYNLRIAFNQRVKIQIFILNPVFRPMNAWYSLQISKLLDGFRSLERRYCANDNINSLLPERLALPKHMIGLAGPAHSPDIDLQAPPVQFGNGQQNFLR